VNERLDPRASYKGNCHTPLLKLPNIKQNSVKKNIVIPIKKVRRYLFMLFDLEGILFALRVAYHLFKLAYRRSVHKIGVTVNYVFNAWKII
jgi:hypothetical protein